MGNTVDSLKNETCMAIELGIRVPSSERSPSLVRNEVIHNEIEEVD